MRIVCEFFVSSSLPAATKTEKVAQLRIIRAGGCKKERNMVKFKAKRKEVPGLKQQVTKRYIQEAFRTLLEEKPMDRITVRDIVEECGLTRNTFYYHYDDIFDLFEDFLKTQLAQAMHDAPQEMTPEEVLLNSLSFLMEKPQVARHIFAARDHEVMLQYLARVAELLIERHAVLDGLTCTPEDRELILSVCSHAVFGMLEERLRLRRDAQIEPDLRRIALLFEGTIRSALIVGQSRPRSQEEAV